ncbi:MAG: hypothetical protein AAGE52_11860 [Myxococcota bacterium]
MFEVIPRRDVLTLDQLTAGLTKFIYKPKLRKQIDRDVARIEEAWKAYREGKRLGGRRWSNIRKGERRGGEAGARAAYEKLRSRAFGRTKTDLRIWSPALYGENGRRDTEHVIHVSCLVLDFDEGATMDKASSRWSDVYHVVHTTWSHTPEAPKFRLVIPLAHPVYAEDWRAFWTWGASHGGMLNDPALKSPASTFALPVTQGLDRERIAFVKRGPLLHPMRWGLVRRAAPPPPAIDPPAASHFRGDPDLRFVTGNSSGRVVDQPSPDDFDLFRTAEDLEDEFDLFGSSSDESASDPTDESDAPAADAKETETKEPDELDDFDLF